MFISKILSYKTIQNTYRARYVCKESSIIIAECNRQIRLCMELDTTICSNIWIFNSVCAEDTPFMYGDNCNQHNVIQTINKARQVTQQIQ